MGGRVLDSLFCGVTRLVSPEVSACSALYSTRVPVLYTTSVFDGRRHDVLGIY